MHAAGGDASTGGIGRRVHGDADGGAERGAGEYGHGGAGEYRYGGTGEHRHGGAGEHRHGGAGEHRHGGADKHRHGGTGEHGHGGAEEYRYGGEPENTATAEPENTATAEPENTATAEPENTATAEPANTATAEPENTATAEPANTATAEPENTATPIPTDAAEVKTIASFEAFAPEGFAVPQGTPETGLGLPASLNVQFADGAAGEVAVAWQCAAGYDPNAEAGTQFAFAAVLPQGYALAEGVFLPQILVTLTPPLANAMLMAEGIVESGDGWTLFDDGKLTVTDKMASDDIPPAIWNAVTSIEVTGDAYLYLWSSFSGGITVKAGGCLTNSGRATLSADVTLEGGRLENLGVLTGSVTVKAGGELYNNFTGTLSCDVTVETGGSFQNHGTITGGDFSGQVYNNSDASITGGDFTDATVENYDGSVTGGVFNGFKLENGVLTITGTVDLKEDEDALAPLTIGLDAESIQSIIVEANATFNAGNNAVDDPVTCNGTITGGTFENSLLDNSGTISGGTFNNGDVLNNPGGTISGGAFSGCTYNFGAITGGTFAEIVLTGASARVQGVDGSVPTLNGPIENGMGGSILQPCNFGANASVVENRGVIEVPATVNNIPQSLRYGEKTLEQLKKINPNDVWFEQAADGTQARVAESATVDLVSRTYVSRNLPAVEAPQAEIDFDGETLTVSLDTSSALPEGLQMGELDVLFTCGGKSGIVRDAFANGNSATVPLSALGNALGLALPAANGSGDASLRVSLSAEGKEDGYNWGVAELTVPERPAATAPGAEKRAHETTDRSIQMLDADMLAEYDFGVAVKAGALPQEPALADEDGDGLITGLAGDTEYCLYFRKKATDGAFRSAWFSSADVSARTNRSIPLAAGVETAEYAWMPDFTLQPSDIAEETVFARVEGGGDQAIPENAFALTITGENGAQVTGTIRDAGTYTVKVALDCDNYVLAAGGDSFTITVRPLDLSSEDVVLRVEGPLTVGYTGASVYPQIGGNVLEVKVGGVDRGALPADCFTIEAVEGRNNVNAGEAYLTIVGQGNATGKTELAYTITARNIADAGVAVEPIPGQTYTGSAIEPKVTVKDGGGVLAEGTDYTVAYANNTAVGTATVTITGMDNYTGTRTVTFAIRAVEKDNEDEASEQDKQEETAAEALTPAQQAEQLIGGRAVDGTVTDRHGEAMPYVPSTEEVTDEETREMLQRTLVITADPVRDENGEIVLRDGAPVYEQRNLHLSRGLLDALAELGYTHIRFVLGDAALEWPLASMTGDGYTVRLAPMEADELSQAEKDATGAVETLTGSYRARVTAMIEGGRGSGRDQRHPQPDGHL